MTDDVDLDAVEMQLAQAYTRSVSHTARGHLRAAMDEIGMDVPVDQSDCPRCEPVEHDC